MVQLSPHKGPPRMQKWDQINLHHQFVHSSSRPAWQWRRLYRATKTYSLIAKFLHVQSLLAVREYCAAGEERGHRQVCVNLWCLMSRYPKRIRTIAVYVSSADLPSDSLRENLWAVTRRTMKNYTTVKIGGCGYECLPGTIQYFTLPHSTWLYYTLPHVVLGSGSFSTTLRVGVLLPVLLCTVWLSETWVIIESDGLLSSGWFIASHCLYTGSGRSYPSSYLSQNGVSWLDEKFGIRRIRCTVLWTWRSFYMYIV